MTKSKAQPLLREARIISQGTLRPDHLAHAMLEALEGFDEAVARRIQEQMPSEPEGVTLAPHETEAWNEFHDLVAEELENEANAHGWTIEFGNDGALLLIRPMYTPKELATELLEHLEEVRQPDTGEPYVEMWGGKTSEVDNLWRQMIDDYDWRMASVAAYHVLDEARRGTEPAHIIDEPHEYAEILQPGHDYELLRWYRGGNHRANYVLEAWEEMDNYGRGDIDGDPVPTMLERGYMRQMAKLIEQAARALDEAAEEFNN